jgi:DNA-binding MarR family transcriptional regulator
VSTTPDTEDQIVVAIRRIMHAVELHSRHLVDVFGLTGPQLLVLSEAARLKEAPIKSIARAVHLSQPTVTGILDRLARRGLIERTRDKADRRAVKTVVTKSGQDLLNQAPSLLQEHFRRELGKLEEWEQMLILSTLQRIASMMETESIEPPVLFMTTRSLSPEQELPDAP